MNDHPTTPDDRQIATSAHAALMRPCTACLAAAEATVEQMPRDRRVGLAYFYCRERAVVFGAKVDRGRAVQWRTMGPCSPERAARYIATALTTAEVVAETAVELAAAERGDQAVN